MGASICASREKFETQKRRGSCNCPSNLRDFCRLIKEKRIDKVGNYNVGILLAVELPAADLLVGTVPDGLDIGVVVALDGHVLVGLIGRVDAGVDLAQ